MLAAAQNIDRETLRLWSRAVGRTRPDLILRAMSAALPLTGVRHLAGTRGTLWIWPAMWFHGVVLIFLFTPLHETIHRTAFKTCALNEAVAFVIGLLMLLPREYFRAFHFAHQRFTQDPAQRSRTGEPQARQSSAMALAGERHALLDRQAAATQWNTPWAARRRVFTRMSASAVR